MGLQGMISPTRVMPLILAQLLPFKSIIIYEVEFCHAKSPLKIIQGFFSIDSNFLKY